MLSHFAFCLAYPVCKGCFFSSLCSCKNQNLTIWNNTSSVIQAVFKHSASKCCRLQYFLLLGTYYSGEEGIVFATSLKPASCTIHTLGFLFLKETKALKIQILFEKKVKNRSNSFLVDGLHGCLQLPVPALVFFFFFHNGNLV